jgi:outer membrane autotransporter protein
MNASKQLRKSNVRNSPFFKVSPVGRPFWTALLNAVPAVLFTPVSLAALVENGAVLNIDATTPLGDYAVRDTGSTLNASNAVAGSISLSGGATLNFVNSSVQSPDDGVVVTASTATITNSTIVGDYVGLSVNRPIGTTVGSQVQVTGGALQGGEVGAQVTGFSRLQLNGVQVTGTNSGSAGLNIFGGDVLANNGTTIKGSEHGVYLISDAQGVGDSVLVLDNATAEGTNGAAILVDGLGRGLVANLNLLNGTTLTGGNGNALEIANRATANVLLQSSEVTGNFAIANGSIANLTFDQGRLIGDVSADATSSGTLALNNGSALRGDVTGIDTVNLNASSITGEVTSASSAGVVSLVGGSALEGHVSSDNVSLNGSSMIGDITSLGSAGVVSLTAGSSLEGNVSSENVNLDASSIVGNVTSTGGASVLRLLGGSTLKGDVSSGDVSLDASSMSGDITSSAGLVSLTNNSVLTGNLINLNNATLTGASTWNMVGSNTVNSLAMNDSTVRFGAPNAFYRLNVGTLSGNGTFIMDADYLTNEHDTLNVTGSATGSHTLLIAGSGVDPTSPTPLTVVQTAGGDATFALAGGPAVDVGTYSYQLTSAGNGAGGTDWFLDPGTATISPGTRSVLALFNTAPTVWYGELTSLRSRMGELRFNGGKAGGWVRTYGNKYDVDEASGVGYRQTQQGVSLGADAPLPIGDGQWLIGVLAGHSTSDIDLTRGTSGTVKSYYAGLYTTWLDQASGYYFDGVLKFNRFRNDSKVSMSDGTRAKGDYDNSAAGGSVEFGRHVKLGNEYFVEPFTQLSAVVIGGKDYELNNGMRAEGDRTRSLLGKVGVTAGRNFTLDSGSVVQPYVRVAGAHEFAKRNEVQVNNNTFNNDLSGSRGELGAGVAVAFSDTLQLHADFDYANGEHIEQPFGANVGLRYTW